jgi:hypothetical protein
MSNALLITRLINIVLYLIAAWTMTVTTWRFSLPVIYNERGELVQVTPWRIFAGYSFASLFAWAARSSLTNINSHFSGNTFNSAVFTYILVVMDVSLIGWLTTCADRPFFRPLIKRLRIRRPE